MSEIESKGREKTRNAILHLPSSRTNIYITCPVRCLFFCHAAIRLSVMLFAFTQIHHSYAAAAASDVSIVSGSPENGKCIKMDTFCSLVARANEKQEQKRRIGKI